MRSSDLVSLNEIAKNLSDNYPFYQALQKSSQLMEIQANIKLFLILIIAFHGFLLAALISIGQLIADRKSIKNWLFLGLFFVFVLFQIHYILFEIGLLSKYKIFNVFPITAFYLLGPILYFITKHSLHKNYKMK